MGKPKEYFTIQEAVEHYAGDPVVICIADDQQAKIKSNTLHSEKQEGEAESWIWAYAEDGSSILLYGPSQFQDNKFVLAEIIKEDEA